MNRNDVKYQSMGDDDIRHYLPDARILTYSELSNVRKIEDLLPRHKSSFILLYPVKSESDGHWIAVTRFSKMIEYYDSYGGKPDVPLTWGKYNNVHRRLSELLNNTKLRVTYNTIDFQNNKDFTISTCGAFAVFRILTMIEMNADLEKNNIILKTLRETNEDKSYDDIVVEFINKR
jgi:hypothetical protein